jgi:hypothetical protein
LVTVGVDSHGEVHVAAAVDQLGRLLATTTTTRGYRQLLTWARGLGQVQRFGVEGTGAFAAGLLRFLHAHGQVVLEVDRPDRSMRRRRGKSDPVDAEAAARAVLSKAAQGVPKARDGKVEMIRALRVARRSTVKARPQAANQLHDLVVSAPEPLRAQVRSLAIDGLVTRAAGFRPGTLATPVAATKLRCASSPAAGWPWTPRSAGSTPSWTAGRPGRTAADRAAWGRHRRGRRAAGRRRRQPPAAAQRGQLRAPVRRRAAGGLLRQDSPSPAGPGRGPAGQQRLVAHRDGAPCVGSSHS